MAIERFPHPRTERRGPALTEDDRSLGLRRMVVATSVGRIVARVDASDNARSSTATILLHGAAGSWTTWTPLLRAAARSGRPLTDVIAIDLPGWGETRGSPRIDVEQLSRAVCEVARALGYRRWVVVGHSMGGFLALDVAARAPRRTRLALLVSPSGPGVIDAARHLWRGAIRLPAFAGMLLVMRLLAWAGAYGRALVRVLHRAGALRAFTAPLFADPEHVHHTVIDALSVESRPREFVDAARAAACYDESVWAAITCPVRSVRGDHDVFVPSSDRSGFSRLIADFDEVVVPAAGHFAAVEQPEAVLAVLRATSGAPAVSRRSARERRSHAASVLDCADLLEVAARRAQRRAGSSDAVNSSLSSTGAGMVNG